MPSFVIDMSVIILGTVAPFTGAWIETFLSGKVWT